MYSIIEFKIKNKIVITINIIQLMNRIHNKICK